MRALQLLGSTGARGTRRLARGENCAVSAGESAAADATASSATEVTRCSNCRAPVTGAFCANCGQETNLRLPTLREFTREAAGRYVAFDGRFWRSLIALFFRPGRLTREYLAGRRRRYVRPARLYLFSTLVFFAVSRFFVSPLNFEVGDEARSSDAGKGSPTKVERSKPESDDEDLAELQMRI